MSSLVLLLLLAAATGVAVVGVGLEAMEEEVVDEVLVWEINEGLLLKEEGG